MPQENEKSYDSTISATESQQAATEGLTNQQQALGDHLSVLLDNSFRAGGDPFGDFPGLTTKLKNKQDELDIMAADSLPAAILTDYVSDVMLPNSNGDLVSIIANNRNHQQILDDIYRRLSLPGDKIVYTLLKNGIVIGEFEQFTEQSVASQVVAANEEVTAFPEERVAAATEATYVRKPGTILPNISIISDTYTVFPILSYEKCIGFLEVKKDKTFFDNFNWETDSINYTDVVIHPTMDYCYETFGNQHSSKPLQLSVQNKDGTIVVYDIAAGCSILEDAYTAWRTLSLLLDSIVLASLIKNAQFMLIEVEGGTATKQQVESAKLKLRSLFEGQLSLSKQGLKSYLSPQAKPAFIYSFVSNGVGKINANLIGGEYNPGQMYYITPFVNAFFAAMRAPKQNYGFTEGAGGLDGGGAVEQYNQRYLSTVARLKRIYASFIKKCINNVLISKGLTNLVDNFTVKVYGAYEETRNQEYQELQTKLQLYESIIQFTGIDDQQKLVELRSLMLKQVITDPAIIGAIDQVMQPEEPAASAGDDDGSIMDLDDSQLSPDVSGELGLDDFGGGDTAPPPGEGPDESLELPEMPDVLASDKE